MLEIIGINGSNKKPKGFEAGLAVLGDRYVSKDLSDISGLESCFYHFGGISNRKNIYSQENYEAIKFIQNSGKPFLVGEFTPFRKIPNYTKIGWFSYNYKDGIFNNANVDISRWKQFQKDNNLEIKDWNHPGDNILIMGQTEYDSALNCLYNEGYEYFYDWVFSVVEKIREISNRPIVIRPHPKNFNIPAIKERSLRYKNVSISKNFISDEYISTRNGGEGLDIDLNSSYCVVSYSSNSTVEAVCKGIPVFVADPGSATYDLSQGSISNIENIDYSKNIDDWGRKIVYSIWNFEEIKTGKCWAHLKPAFF
jgi:hypothetical protein